MVHFHDGAVRGVEHLGGLLDVGDLEVVDVNEGVGDHFLVELVLYRVTVHFLGTLGLHDHVIREVLDPVLKVGHDTIGSTPLSLTVRPVILLSISLRLVIEGYEERVISWVVE